MSDQKPTVATLSQQIDDHLVDCVNERLRTNKSLDRIWAGLGLRAGRGFLFVHAYPPGQ